MSRAHDDYAILQQRARTLALPAVAPERLSARPQLLLFARGSGRYAIDTRFVMQVVPLADYVQIPFAAAPCLGLALARGELLALFDLPGLTGGKVSSETAPRSMLLCGEVKLEFGLAVDEALDLVDASELLEPPWAGASGSAHEQNHEARLVSGVDARGFIVIDGAALLSDPRLTLQPAKQESVS
jgi:chemotaxis signal transduction protein